jgi:hypothetical protein
LRRLRASNGTTAAPDNTYDLGSRVPAGPWRTVDRAEQEQALRIVGLDIRRGPPAARAAARVIARDHLRTTCDLHSWCISDVGNAAISAAAEGIAASSRERTETLGWMVTPPGLTTTTRDAAGCFIGLHLDNWDRRPMGSRHESRNRLVANLGPGSREFLFVALPLERIVSKVARTAVADQHGTVHPSTEHARVYLAEAWDIPVYALSLRPNECCVVPTETVVHDGCTADSSLPSVALHILGRF